MPGFLWNFEMIGVHLLKILSLLHLILHRWLTISNSFPISKCLYYAMSGEQCVRIHLVSTARHVWNAVLWPYDEWRNEDQKGSVIFKGQSASARSRSWAETGDSGSHLWPYLSRPSHSVLLHSMACFSLLGCKILKVWTLSLITLPYLPASCLAHRRLSTNASWVDTVVFGEVLLLCAS